MSETEGPAPQPSPPPQGTGAPKRRRPWILIVALILSLSLNVFGLAWLGARLGHDHRGARGPDWGLERFVHTLPREARSVLRERFKAERPAFRERFEAVREARSEVARQLKADPLDKARLATALDELRDSQAALQSLAHDLIAATVAEMPPEVRGRWEPKWHRRKGHEP